MTTQYEYWWSVSYRIDHWVRVIALAVLTFTGFYVYWPFLPGGEEGGFAVMSWMRFAHFVSAYIVILGLVVRVYLAFRSTFDADWRDFGLLRNVRNIPDILLYYLFLKDTHKAYRRYNPLQALTYLLRTGPPDGQDLLGATNFAILAVRLLKEEKFGRMTVYQQRYNLTDVYLNTVTQGVNGVNVEEMYDVDQYKPKVNLIWAAQEG